MSFCNECHGKSHQVLWVGWGVSQQINTYLDSHTEHFLSSGARKPTNAQGHLYYTHQITLTCFSS
jgi:hypothetical protein